MPIIRRRPDPPADAERFVVTHRSITVSAPRLREDLDLDAEALAEEYELTESPAARAGMSVTFGAGDTLPAEVAREVYSAFHDRLAAYDGDGNRLD